MQKTTFRFGPLHIEYVTDESSNGVTPVSLQENLDSMITTINQKLDALPETEKVAFLKNDEYPDGTFILEKNGQNTPIVPQYLLERLQAVMPDVYRLSEGEKWGWSIANPKTDVEINELDSDFKQHVKDCLNKYIEDGTSLKYPLNFTYKIIATVVNAPQVSARSSKKFQFTVRAAKESI